MDSDQRINEVLEYVKARNEDSNGTKDKIFQAAISLATGMVAAIGVAFTQYGELQTLKSQSRETIRRVETLEKDAERGRTVGVEVDSLRRQTARLELRVSKVEDGFKDDMQKIRTDLTDIKIAVRVLQQDIKDRIKKD